MRNRFAYPSTTDRHLVALFVVLAACGERSTDVRRAVSHPRPVEVDAGTTLRALRDEVPAGRLPRDVTPTRYTIELSIDPSTDRFAGHTTIDVTLTEPRDRIWIHGRDLHVVRVVVSAPGGTPEQARWEDVDAAHGVAAIHLPHVVAPGRMSIDITYDAPFNRQATGLARVRGGDDDYAFTQFEAIDARRAFPCFDDPGFKTPFDVTLVVRAGDVALSNTRERDSTPTSDGRRRVRFTTTEPLPTYLVAFAVGPFDVREGPPIAGHHGPVPLRAIAPRGHGAELAFALDRAGSMVAELARYTGQPYPYDKLDLIAVPEFSLAMENAGLITFRDTLLLVSADAPVSQRREVSIVIAHELAHHWFGNLVTSVWWDEIWLNEAFATWMESRVVDRLWPDEHAMEARVESTQHAFGFDVRRSTRMIRQPIESTDDIASAFDSITYSKGAAVLAMFERWLGDDVFQRGIQRYLSAHRHGTATTADLLEALSEAAAGGSRTREHAARVTPSFASFLDQSGAPNVAAELVCDASSAALVLTQSRYLPAGQTAPGEQRWQIPVCLRYGRATGAAHETCVLVTEPTMRVALEGTCPTWVMPNAGAAGYYRFSVRPASALPSTGVRSPLTVPERMALADALAASMSSGATPFADVMRALAPFARAEERVLATQPMGVLSGARDELVEPALRPRVQAYARALYAPVFARVGWTPRRGESPETNLLRADVIGFLAQLGNDRAVRAEALRRGRAWLGVGGDGRPHRDVVDPELAGVVLTVAVQDGGTAVFDAALAALRTETDALQRTRLIRALGGARAPDVVERARALVLDPQVTPSELWEVISAQLDAIETRDGAWAWMQRNFDGILARIASFDAGWLPYYVANFCDDAHRAEVEGFFRPRLGRMDGGPRALQSSLEKIDLCIARRRAQHASATELFGSTRSARP